MCIYNMLNAVKLFIISSPMECLFFGGLMFMWIGSFLESTFKFWDWGPQCNKCEEWVLWCDSVVHCTKCDDARCNDEYQSGMDKGILETLR